MLGIRIGTLAHIAAATLALGARALVRGRIQRREDRRSRIPHRPRSLDVVLEPRRAGDRSAGANSSVRSLGIVVNVLNEDGALLLAFLPRFVVRTPPPSSADRIPQVIFAARLVTDSLGARHGHGRRCCIAPASVPYGRSYVTGSVYVGLGVATAFAGSVEDSRRRRSRRAARASSAPDGPPASRRATIEGARAAASRRRSTSRSSRAEGSCELLGKGRGRVPTVELLESPTRGSPSSRTVSRTNSTSSAATSSRVGSIVSRRRSRAAPGFPALGRP